MNNTAILLIFLLCALNLNAQTESEKLNNWFEEKYQENLNRYPEWLSYQGRKDRYDEWDDESEKEDEASFQRSLADLKYLKENFDFEKLDDQSKVSYRLFVKGIEEEIAWRPFKYHSFPVNQMFGRHTGIPSFLINVHRIDNLSDAQAYLKRLQTMDKKVNQLITDLEIREKKGIIAPAFVFPKVLEDSQNIITGHPFQNGAKDCTVLADFRGKLDKIKLRKRVKKKLIAEAEKALLDVMQPSYWRLISTVKRLQSKAEGNNGAWSLPEGAAFYKRALQSTTTTEMTPDQIFATGQSEIKRIHEEMRTIMRQTGFKGDLNEFFAFMKEDPQFYYDNTDEGREEYLDKTNEVIDGMRKKLDDLFAVKPKAELIVKRVEPFREKSAGKAFYNRGAPDGSRPGTYYANLYDMTQMPWYQMEALAYHEAIPGHHMQISIAMELEGLPKFRKYGGYTAYTEGWGLYSELVPKEIGFYEDPYSDFGRLAMELWRACRLVADVGIHNKQWTREEAIALYADNTPNPYEDCVKMVERHFVMPSQATAYKIGMLKILELREAAKAKLGDKFDIRGFHDTVLKNGPVPLSVLEEYVNEWVASVIGD